jgi:hypothetical protein
LFDSLARRICFSKSSSSRDGSPEPSPWPRPLSFQRHLLPGKVLKFLVHTSRNCCKPQWKVALLTAQHTTCQSSCHIVSQNYIHSVQNCEFFTYLLFDHMLNFLNLGSKDSEKSKSKYL